MVSMENLNLFYPNGHQVLYDINIQIESGECVLFCGESGSGKTSLLNTINGISTNYENCRYDGKVELDGENIKELELFQISQLISSVFQNPKTHFFNIDTTIELLFYLENLGYPRKEMKIRLDKLLELFPIKHLLDRNIFNLSGGEKQILTIAACYIAGNKIIVLDEPSSNLDKEYVEILSKMLEKLKDKGVTILIAEHRLYYLMDIVDRIFYMENGIIEREYSRKEFLNETRERLKSKGLRSLNREKLEVDSFSKNGSFYIEELSYNFNKSNRVLKVSDIYLKEGNIYGIIGRNGIGKSTFIKSMIGVNRSSREMIYLKKKKLKKRDRLKLSNLVMQDVNHQLFTDSVAEEIILNLDNFNKELYKKVLEKLNLWDIKDRHPMSLSGGQKQRVAIASVIMSNDKVIYMDEPTSGMDYRNMIEISNLIKSLSYNNKIILIASHDTEFLNRTVDNIINLEDFSISYKI